MIGSIYPGDEYECFLTFLIDITSDTFSASIEQSGISIPMTYSVAVPGSKIKFNVQETATTVLTTGNADVVFKWTSGGVKRTLPKQTLEIK